MFPETLNRASNFEIGPAKLIQYHSHRIFVHFRFLGRGTVQIRKTNETPPRISIIDVAIAVTGKTHHDAAQDYRRLLNQYPEVGTNWFHLKFPGRGQRDTGKGFEFSGPREIK